MKLKDLRISKNLSQRELSADLGVAPNTLSQWERGLRKPDPDTLTRIARYFNISIDYLLGNAFYDNTPSIS